MTDVDDFEVATVGRSRWPDIPERWSYSSLYEAEECPRRWALARASYPDVWERPGYPPRPGFAALVGDIIHLALEHVLVALHSRAVDEDATGVSVLRSLGGYSALVRRCISDRLNELEQNPRVAPRLDTLRASLGQNVPEIRHRVQSVVTRMRLASVDKSPADHSGRERGPLANGSYPEIELRAETLRFIGRPDLISVSDEGVTITDYKTGQPEPRHANQLHLYALLWKHDVELNPTARVATRLVIAYASEDKVIAAPTETDLENLQESLAHRIDLAERDISLRPPPARPAPETCRFCSVKHMCEEYWSALPMNHTASNDGAYVTFIDCEGVVTGRNGPRSFVLESQPMGVDMLLRTPTETPPFTTGDRVRLVGVTYTEDDDAEQRVATITQASEVFVISS